MDLWQCKKCDFINSILNSKCAHCDFKEPEKVSKKIYAPTVRHQSEDEKDLCETCKKKLFDEYSAALFEKRSFLKKIKNRFSVGAPKLFSFRKNQIATK
jgi:hypothetical protein